MLKQTGKLIVVCSGLLAFGLANGSDVQLVSLGNCISQLEEEGDLAIEICEAKRARASLRPGSPGCAALFRVDNRDIYCSKSDTASVSMGAEAAFRKYYAKVGAPISIGSANAFYGNKSAGADNRFSITQRDDGKLEMHDGESPDGGAGHCVFSSNSTHCERNSGYVGYGIRTNTKNVFTLRMDGLLVEQYRQGRRCVKYRCRSDGCSRICEKYDYNPIRRTASQIHPWN